MARAFDFGDLRRLTPISRWFGYDRGTPIDRHYIESFLLEYSDDIAGRTLEIGDDAYTRQFGAEKTTRRDVLHVDPDAANATYVGDLTDGNNIPSATFDCCVITQTLHLIHDTDSAIQTLHRILKPGGVLLATVPGISQISADEWSRTWSWAFTSRWAETAFRDVFGPKVSVRTYGTVGAAAAFLQGVSVEELAPEMLDAPPDCEMLIAIRAIRT